MDIVTIFETFPTNDDCIAHIERVRWETTPVCPYCNSPNQTPMPKEKRYHCNNCNTSFSVTVGTIFHHSRLPLQKWFLAIFTVLNTKNDLSARQLGRYINVNKNTAWRMLTKIRQVMLQHGQRELLVGLFKTEE